MSNLVDKMYKFSWKSKGQTLLWLEYKLQYSSVPKLIVFTYGEWKNNQEKILNKIKVKFIDNKIAVRSSSINEDSIYFSNAYIKSTIVFSPSPIHAKSISLHSKTLDPFIVE